MNGKNYNVIGVMSGTSLDGADLAHILFTEQDGKWEFAIGAAQTVAYSNGWVNRLREAVDFSPEELVQLDKDYTLLLSGIINDFIKRNNIGDTEAICSHGHTILHRPAEGVTLQIGNRPEIATLTGRRVVCDFRVQDVELGGQGAPLVPIGDRVLFPGYDYCLNLGGFSNISFEKGGNRIAFDICPVNTVLNHYARRAGQEYDDRGRMAASGNIVLPLLEELNSLGFYEINYPKSLGFEFVKETVIPLIEKYDAPVKDILRTFTEHIAIQVSATINKIGKSGKLLITGGGAYNDFLVQRLRLLLPDTEIVIPDDKTIQYKEALIFGLLGVLRLRGEVNVLASVTGAAHDHSSGKIFGP